MIVECKSCGANLRVNQNLAGTAISCPECGAGLEIPTEPPPPRTARRTPGRSRRRREEPERKAVKGLTFSLFLAQTLLVLLAAACFVGAFLRDVWNPPATSFMGDNPLALVSIGFGLLIAVAVSKRFPITSTLVVVLTVLTMCALHYRTFRVVDASRVIALSASMIALWLAMEHRGVT